MPAKFSMSEQILGKPGALQLTETGQAVLNAVDVSSLSDQGLVDPQDVLLDRDLQFALLFVLFPGFIE